MSDFPLAKLGGYVGLLGGVALYLQHFPDFISQHLQTNYEVGLQVGLILLLFIPATLTLIRVTKLEHSSIQTDGGYVAPKRSIPSIQPTIWGGFGGAVIVGTLGIPYGIFGIVVGVIIGTIIGTGIEYVYLNYATILQLLGLYDSEGKETKSTTGVPDAAASDAAPGARVSADALDATASDETPVTASDVPYPWEFEGISPDIKEMIKNNDKYTLEDFPSEQIEKFRYISDIDTNSGNLYTNVTEFEEELDEYEYYYAVELSFAGNWTWQMRDSNGDILARSGSFTFDNSNSDMIEAIHDIQEIGFVEARIYQIERVEFKIHEENSENMRWRLVSGTGEIIRQSSGAYENEEELLESIVDFIQDMTPEKDE